jgi:hypothetical protein
VKIESIDASVQEGDGKPGVDPHYALVTIGLTGGRNVRLMIHQSHLYADTLTVEIDGDFTAADPALRINVNDNLIHDTRHHPNRPPLPDDAEPDLPDYDPHADELEHPHQYGDYSNVQ